MMPEAYFTSTESLVEPLPGAGEVTFCAWFRNLQPKPVGVAFDIRCTVVLQILGGEGSQNLPESLQSDLKVPYLESDKHVCIEIFWGSADVGRNDQRDIAPVREPVRS
jgi:hypothetical protein